MYGMIFRQWTYKRKTVKWEDNMIELNEKNTEYVEKHGIFPIGVYEATDNQRMMYYALYPIEKTIYKITVIDGIETERKSCPSLLNNPIVYNNAVENYCM